MNVNKTKILYTNISSEKRKEHCFGLDLFNKD